MFQNRYLPWFITYLAGILSLKGYNSLNFWESARPLSNAVIYVRNMLELSVIICFKITRHWCASTLFCYEDFGRFICKHHIWMWNYEKVHLKVFNHKIYFEYFFFHFFICNCHFWILCNFHWIQSWNHKTGRIAKIETHLLLLNLSLKLSFQTLDDGKILHEVVASWWTRVLQICRFVLILSFQVWLVHSITSVNDSVELVIFLSGSSSSSP